MTISSCTAPSFQNFIQEGKTYEFSVVERDFMTNTENKQEPYLITFLNDDLSHYNGLRQDDSFVVFNDSVKFFLPDGRVLQRPTSKFYLHKNLLGEKLSMAKKASKWWLVYKPSKLNDTSFYSLRRIYNPAAFGTYYALYQQDSSFFLIRNYFVESNYHVEQMRSLQFKLVKNVEDIKQFKEASKQVVVKQDRELRHCDSLRPVKKLTPVDLNHKKHKAVVVYGYTSCPPCALLKNELSQAASNGDLNPEQIKLINTYNDSSAVAYYQSKRQLPFQYIRHDVKCMGGAAPVYAAYDENGDLLWQRTGYTESTSVSEIISFLKK